MMLIFKYFLINYNIKNMCDYSENNINCCKKKSYGEFCNKHKRNHLVKKDLIIFNNFTYKSSDYLKDDIRNTINNLSSYPEHKKTLKKEVLYSILLEKFNKLKHFNDHIKSIKYIQLNFKKKYDKLNELIRGEGFINKKLCNNNEDFFTYEDNVNIEDIYFISYKDNNNLIWCFDIRSLNKLFEYDDKNPYTREVFPNSFIDKAKKITHLLKVKNLQLNYNSEIIKERKNNIKQLTVDLFSEIEISGYDCNINWFLDLNLHRLKNLYKILEDIWNYRAMLSQEVKNNIAPPNGIVFNTPLNQVVRISSKRELQELIINDVSIFKNAITSSDKTLGFMYFLIGLGFVSPPCYSSYNYLITF